jgi:hypothetical protein
VKEWEGFGGITILGRVHFGKGRETTTTTTTGMVVSGGDRRGGGDVAGSLE